MSTNFSLSMHYGIIFAGNSSNSGKIFTLQKEIVRIMAGAQSGTTCRSLFKKLEILPVPCQYILSLINFIINNQEIFQTNSSIHNINIRNKHHLHRANAHLSCFQNSTFYVGIKIFNILPSNVTILKVRQGKCKAALRKCLTHSFYSVDEFFIGKCNL